MSKNNRGNPGGREPQREDQGNRSNQSSRQNQQGGSASQGSQGNLGSQGSRNRQMELDDSGNSSQEPRLNKNGHVIRDR